MCLVRLKQRRCLIGRDGGRLSRSRRCWRFNLARRRIGLHELTAKGGGIGKQREEIEARKSGQQNPEAGE
jgi:hypothetical protein